MYISTEVNDGQHVFACICSYDERMIPKGAGFYWNPSLKKWITPYLSIVSKLAGRYEFDAGAINLYNTLSKSQLKRETDSRATDSNIEIPVPEGLNYLPYQKAGIEYASTNNNVLLADQMGLGKSIQAIGLINLLKIKSVLLICPASLKLNWQRELEKWLVDSLKIEILDTKKSKNVVDADIIIVNYDILHKFEWLRVINWGLIICDEVHFVKNPKSKRSKYVYGEWDSNKNTYKIKPLQADRKLLLTGTPILNRPIELFSILQFLGFRMKWLNYVEKFCDGHQTEWGWDVKGSSNELELQQLLRSNYMIRRLKADVLKELPPKIRQIIEIPVEKFPKQIRAEMRLLDNLIELRAKLKTLKKDNSSDFNEKASELISMQRTYLAELSRIRHITALAKIPHIVEHVKDSLESCNKIVIFAHHLDVIEALKLRFPTISVSLVGNDKVEDRQEAVDRFQNDPNIHLFIGSITAAGVGITLTAASLAIFVELTWVPGDISQAEDRCVYQGQYVFTIDGYKKIENITLEDKVLTHKGNFKSINAIKSKLERKKLKVTINAFGFTDNLEVTEDHELYVFNTNKRRFEWIEASLVRPGKHCLVFNPGELSTKFISEIEIEKPFKTCFVGSFGSEQRNGRMAILPDKVELIDDLLYAMGFYVANGHARLTDHSGKKSSSISVCDDARTDIDKVERVCEIFSRTFDINKINYYTSKNNVISGTLYSITLAYNFKKWFGDSVYSKKFPEWVFSLNIEQCRHLLQGYYDGDGYSRRNTQQGCTTSSKLITQILLLEGKCGNTISAGYSDQSKVWVIEYTSKDSDKKRINIIDGKILYPVKSITFSRPRRGTKRVFDLSIEDDNSFVVGLYSVHNCHRIGQKDSVHIQHIVIDGSIDSKLVKTMVEKQEIIDRCLDSNELFDDSMKIKIDDLFDDDLITEDISEDADIDNIKVEIDEESKKFILSCLKFLASACDGATRIDGVGFNKYDTNFGKSLASNTSLTDKQARIGLNLVRKYRNQLDLDSQNKIYILTGGKA